MGIIRMTRAAALASCLLTGGCAHQPMPNLAELNREEPYRIGREDVVDIAVWRDADLSRVVPVRPDGFISLPMAGEVMAAGRTPVELEAAIKEKLLPYVQAPKVTVIVREVNSARVFVTGEVQNPGAFPLRGRVSVMQAIALAGGFSAFADANDLVVIRPGEREKRIPVRYSDLVAKEGAQPDLVLRPGDTVVVP